MKTKSIWNEVETKKVKNITKNLETDVLIIGGGITGLSVLYELKNKPLKTVLVERNKCGEGVTSKSTAKITYLQNDTIKNIASLVSEDKAKKYLKSQVHAVKKLSSIIKRENIDCDLEEVDSYVFTTEKRNINKLEKIENILRECGIDVSLEKNFFSASVKRAIKTSNTFVFHPKKYTNALKEILKNDIYENSKVDKIEKIEDYYISRVNGCEIKSRYVVLATHYPYFLYPYFLPLKTHIEVSYLGAKRVEKTKDYSAINIDKPTVSMRFHRENDNRYLIYLFGSTISCNVGNIEKNFDDLKSVCNFDYIWSNNDIISADYIPLIGPIVKGDNTFLLATGYNTWGMTNGTLAGEIIASYITDEKSRYADLFDPPRSINSAKILHFPLDVGSNIISYTKSNRFNVNNTSVTYEKREGVAVAVYKDKKGVEHVVLNRCPHLKCGVILNEEEQTWDCFCHGSRFDLDGKCIEGPSNYDISFPPTKKN